MQRIRNFVLDVLNDTSGTAAGHAASSGGSGSDGEDGEGDELGQGCGAPRSLYIAGVPGTGKTASVMEVMRGLLAEAKAGGAAPFRFAEINALRLPSPKHLYARVVEALTGAAATRLYMHSVVRLSSRGRFALRRPHRHPCLGYPPRNVPTVNGSESRLQRRSVPHSGTIDWTKFGAGRLL